MALSEPNQNKIVQILADVTPQMLESQITYLGDRLTAQIQTDIEALITQWDGGAGAKYHKVHPGARNFHVELDSASEKNFIRDSIAKLLEKPEWGASSGSSEISIFRG